MTDDLCPTCGVGHELPSGRCDHCNSVTGPTLKAAEVIVAEGYYRQRAEIERLKEENAMLLEDNAAYKRLFDENPSASWAKVKTLREALALIANGAESAKSIASVALKETA